MKIYIYAIWFSISKKYYIGQTCNLKKRIPDHFKSGSLVCKALWKYDEWQISILHTCKTRNEANRIEIEEIRNFNSVAPNGYNLTAGGDGLFNPSIETRRKISEARRGKYHSEKTKKKMSINHANISGDKNPMKHPEVAIKVSKALKGTQYRLGCQHSEETKKKIGTAQKGRKHSKRTKIKMSISNLRNRLTKLED